MAEFIQMIPGAGTKDGAVEKAQGLGYPADGVNNTAGWNMYVPSTLRTATSLTLRLTFLDNGDAGNAVFTVAYSSGNAADGLLLSGSTQIIITFTGVSSTIYSEDIDITSWVDPSSTLLIVNISRDSDEVGDTLAATAYFFNGRTLV